MIRISSPANPIMHKSPPRSARVIFERREVPMIFKEINTSPSRLEAYIAPLGSVFVHFLGFH
jgi:hypothetical protein